LGACLGFALLLPACSGPLKNVADKWQEEFFAETSIVGIYGLVNRPLGAESSASSAASSTSTSPTRRAGNVRQK
jgi:hypothetical protein